MASKLQIRAQIIELVDKLDINSLNDDTQQGIVKEIKDFDDREFLLQVLVKELNSDDDNKIQKIAYLLLEMNDFESIKDNLWGYIKDASVSDRVKEICCTLLRAFGEKISPEDLLDYLDNPMELIDAETKKLLDVALVNPEVQIDFLDFLFALGEKERESLVKSLEEDYQGDRLVNILYPVLDASSDESLKELILQILGTTKCYSAVAPLQNIVNYSNSEKLKKTANISLKMLRIAGISPDDEQVYAHDSLLCQNSKPYKCFVSEIDGMGNQGVIISRVSDDEKIQMFSVVASDTLGIVDCFGFYSLTKTEFDRIVESFDRDAIKIVVSGEYAKARILNAEKISRQNQDTLPYEYIAWRALIHDFMKLPNNLSYMVFDWSENQEFVNYKILLDSEILNMWFFEEGDNEDVDKFLEQILVKDFKVDESLDIKIAALVSKVFDETMINRYVDRLSHTAYLFNTLEEEPIRDNLALVAHELLEGESPQESMFLLWVIRKTVFEAILREKEKLEGVVNVEATPFARNIQTEKSVFDENQIESIIEQLQQRWEY